MRESLRILNKKGVNSIKNERMILEKLDNQ